jgi:TonB family protein
LDYTQAVSQRQILGIALVSLSALLAIVPDVVAQNLAGATQRTQEISRYPVCVQCPEPQMTRKARALHVKGIVFLQGTVTERGTIEQIVVVKGLNYGFTQRAVETVHQWRVSPPIGIDGKPMRLRIAILVSFGLGAAGRGIATG